MYLHMNIHSSRETENSRQWSFLVIRSSILNSLRINLINFAKTGNSPIRSDISGGYDAKSSVGPGKALTLPMCGWPSACKHIWTNRGNWYLRILQKGESSRRGEEYWSCRDISQRMQ